jgi:G3E family GTPase
MTLSSSASDKTTEFLSLPNGCLCCSIKEPGIAAIEDLVARKGEEGSALDWVVVELTGVADPGTVNNVSRCQNRESRKLCKR